MQFQSLVSKKSKHKHEDKKYNKLCHYPILGGG